MGSDRPTLAFDTSAAHCAAALLLGGRIIVRSEAMARGQAERLMPLLQEVLENEGLRFGDLGRIGVGIGPGNFTGIRISVAAARGLALSLGVPAIGVSGLEAMRALSVTDIAAISGPRGTAYVQQGASAPVILPVAEVPKGAAWVTDPADLVASIAHKAADVANGPPPAPLYLRAADATPARDAPPVILG